MDTVRNVPGIWTSLYHWLGYMFFVAVLPKKVKGPVLWILAAAILAVQTVMYEAFIADRDGVYFNVMSAVFALWTLLPFLIFSETGLSCAVYYCARAFIIAGFGVSLGWQFYTFYFSRVAGMEGLLGESLFMTLTAAAVMAVIFFVERPHFEEDRTLRIRHTDAIVTAVTALAIYIVSSLSYMRVDAPFTATEDREIYNLRTLVYFSGVALMFALHMQRCDSYSKAERAAMQNVLNTQYANYKANQESVAIVNQKYHDLKHQIALLRSGIGDDKKLRYIDEVEREISSYEAQNKTGNEILDTILTGKSLYCHERGITFTCVADGQLLDFLSVMDMSAIFGNALDNAIESVEKLDDAEERLIHLTVSRQRGFVNISVRNRYKKEPQFQGGLPLTTKNEKESHGYGVKSIKQTAEKYGGTASVGIREGWFQLSVLIPIPADK